MREKASFLKVPSRLDRFLEAAVRGTDIRRMPSLQPVLVKTLVRAVKACTGISSDALTPVIAQFEGLPTDHSMTDTLVSTLRAWIPALKAGYAFCGRASSLFSKIPHTVRIHNRGPDTSPGRWLYVLEIEEGPLRGHRLPMSVSDRMAAVMLMCAAGPRIMKDLPRMRPYDLHGMILPIGFQQTGGNLVIRQVYNPGSYPDSNRSRMRQYLGKCLLVEGATCLDCGRGPETCKLSRHDTEPSRGPCICCDRTSTKLNVKGVCVSCVQTALKDGVPLRLPSPEIPQTTPST